MADPIFSSVLGTPQALPHQSVFSRRSLLALQHTALGLTTCLLIVLLALAILVAGTKLGWAQRALPLSPVEEELPAGLYFNANRTDAAYAAPLQESEVAISVKGLVQRVTVTQVFTNPTNRWMEGVYVYPLPEDSAVDRLTMVIGERRVEGVIKEKAEAKRLYSVARDEGKRASLVSAARPNVFSTSVANIGPGETIVIEIGYQDRVRFEAGRFSLRFPMVVAPRYSPASDPLLAEAPSANNAASFSPLTGEASDLFGPVAHPGEGPINKLRLSVLLDAGLPLQKLESAYHDVIVDQLRGSRHLITLAADKVPADCDFLLEWQPQASASPQSFLFAEEVAGDSFLFLTLLPPSQTDDDLTDQIPDSPPREVTFVIDTSGSMYGESMEEAKEALLRALTRLRRQDSFNIIRFANDTSALFPSPQEASAGKVKGAWYYVKSLEADGGTVMAPALRRALASKPKKGTLKQVVFITDGAISNEEQLFSIIADQLGEARLSTVGIGTAPNSYFMRKAAQLGRGSAVSIGDPEEVSKRMAGLFQRLESTLLSDLDVQWPQSIQSQQSFPARIPDLYKGEPLTLVTKLPGTRLEDLSGDLTISGTYGGRPWRQSLSLSGQMPAHGISALWGRAKIDALEDQLHEGLARDQMRAQALEVALTHGLVTRYSSLVAIDDAVVRPSGEALLRGEVARNLPAAWNYAKVFGDKVFGEKEIDLPLQPLPRDLLQNIGFRPVALPQTATPAMLQMIGGLVMLMAGLLFFLYSRRHRVSRA